MKIPNGKTVSMKEKLTGDFVIQVNGFIWEGLNRLMDETFSPAGGMCRWNEIFYPSQNWHQRLNLNDVKEANKIIENRVSML